MKELVRTNDMVKMSWLRALLSDAGIQAFVLDQNTSVLEGSVIAIVPRLMVSDDDFSSARALLVQAGEEAEL